MRIEVITGGISITLDAVLPDKWRKYKVENARCMWLLHDKFDASGDWISFTQAEIFAEDHDLALLCPSANSARYNNWLNGCSWQTFLTEELWEYVHEMLPISRNPKDNALFGYGRGGFGALKFALTNPERFGAACAVSYNDSFVTGYINGLPGSSGKFKSGYPPPEEVAVSQENILWLARQFVQNGKPRPPVYLACAMEEKTYPRSVEIRDTLLALGYDVIWEEQNIAGGWRFCNEQLEKAMCLFDKNDAFR